MATLSTKFGSFLLDDTNKVVIERWNEELITRTDFQSREFGEGSILQRKMLVGRQVKIGGSLAGTDQDNARSNLDALITALGNGPQLLQRYSGRVILAELSANVTFTERSGSGLVYYNWNASLRSEDPYWRSTTLTTTSFSKSGVGPWSQLLSVNSGSVFARPAVNMTLSAGGSLTNKTIKVRNDSAGKELRIHGIDWNQGTSIEIDFANRYVHDGLGNEVFPQTVEGDWWVVDGAGAASTLVVAHDFGGASTVDFIVSWYPQYNTY